MQQVNEGLQVGPVADLERVLAETPEVYSASELDTFQRCRRKGFYEYELRIGSSAPAVAADAGTVFHAGAATLRKTWDVDESVAVLRAAHDKLFAWVKPSGYKLAGQYEREHLVEVLLRYGLEVYRYDTFPAISPDHVEVGFICRLDDPQGQEAPAHFYGKIDYIGRGGHIPHVAPVDIKTTKSWGEDFADKWDPFQQGDIYFYVCKELFPSDNVTGFYIDGVLLQAKTIAFNRIFVQRDTRDLVEMKRELFWWIKQMRAARAENFWPKSTNQCTAFGSCAYKRLCTSHMLPAVLASFPRRGPRSFHFTNEL